MFAYEIQVQLREVVLDDTDVPRALVDYVHKNCINNFVVGSSTRSALARFLFFFYSPSLCLSLLFVKSNLNF